MQRYNQSVNLLPLYILILPMIVHKVDWGFLLVR